MVNGSFELHEEVRNLNLSMRLRMFRLSFPNDPKLIFIYPISDTPYKIPIDYAFRLDYKAYFTEKIKASA